MKWRRKLTNKPPILIGISGASGSGKTTIARALKETLGSSLATLISLDDYYKDLSNLSPEERCAQNFDLPEAIEHSLLCQQLSQLKRGKRVELPRYDFSTHTRQTSTNLTEAKQYFILEGIFALSYPTVREQLDLSIFVQCAEPICLSRRLERDISERGRSEESVLKQYFSTVLPAFEAHIEPQAAYADLIVEGIDDTTSRIEQILKKLRNLG